jgi:hypothetical protein
MSDRGWPVRRDAEPNVRTPEQAAEFIRGRFSTPRKAQEQAWDHVMDQPRGSEAQEYWLKVYGLLGGRGSLGAPLKSNKKARPIGKRPAMDTGFGIEIEDPDTLPTKPGRDLDKAMDRYETFHAKKPLRLIELEHELPDEWVCIGDALSVMYRTDKWKPDGTDEDYKHLHDKGDEKPYDLGKGVRLYEPSSEASRSRVDGDARRAPSAGRRLPVARPEALALLGYCLGLFVRRDDDSEVYEVNPRGCYLFSSPSGNMLALYSPDEQPDGSSGFLAVMAGGNLRVLKDGIDG